MNSQRQNLHFRRITPAYPLQRHNSDDAADIQELLAAFSGNSRATRIAFVLIQRFLPYFPPVISAEVMHNLQ